MFDPEYIISLYFDGNEALTRADVDHLSEWIGQSRENVLTFVQASLIHRTIYDVLVGDDAKKNVLLDFTEATKGGYDVIMDGNASGGGINTKEDLSEEKEKTSAADYMSAGRKYFIDVLKGLGEDEKAAPVIEIPKETQERELIQKVVYPTREKRKISRFNVFTLVMSTAAILAFVLFVKLVPLKDPYKDTAIMTDCINSQWSDTSKPAGIGSELSFYDGDRFLNSGFIKLLFGSGAEVVIEAPASFRILSGNDLAMLSGRAYSTVTEKAKGFTVHTPHSEVMDLGTEFGVEVIGDDASVHMIKGKASVLTNSKLPEQKPVEITAGIAKWIGKNGATQDVRVDDKKFVSDISSKMKLIYRAGKAIEVGRWDNQSDADLEKDLHINGRLAQAVNLGPKSATSATVCGIPFEPLMQDESVSGGKNTELTKINFYDASDNGLTTFFATGRELNNDSDGRMREMQIGLKNLEIGRLYRIQVILGFYWRWSSLECYGPQGEYMYFPSRTSDPKVGLATFRWKADSSSQVIKFRNLGEAANRVYVFGYVLHEIDKGDFQDLNDTER
jgi:hypothetical protein